MKTRAEHLKWCKERANECLDNGNISEAFTSMASDLSKHPETEDHMGIELGMMLLLGNQLETEYQMKEYIDGFN